FVAQVAFLCALPPSVDAPGAKTKPCRIGHSSPFRRNAKDCPLGRPPPAAIYSQLTSRSSKELKKRTIYSLFARPSLSMCNRSQRGRYESWSRICIVDLRPTHSAARDGAGRPTANSLG